VHVDGGGDFGMGVIHRELTPWERRSSSGLREMLGYAHAVKAVALREGPRLRGKVIDIVGDSQVCMYVFRKGGSMVVDAETGELELLEALLDIRGTVTRCGFEVLFRWVPRDLIDGADALSKVVGRMDFGLRADVLDYVLREHCPADLDTVIDRFAANYNAVVGRFNSRFDTPAAEAVDAFTQFWGDDFNYVLGDFNKTDAIMDYIERDDAEAVVIVPEHTSKPFLAPNLVRGVAAAGRALGVLGRGSAGAAQGER
jgi:hypothetical protein